MDGPESIVAVGLTKEPLLHEYCLGEGVRWKDVEGSEPTPMEVYSAVHGKRPHAPESAHASPQLGVVQRTDQSILFPGEIIPVPLSKSRLLPFPTQIKFLVWYSVMGHTSSTGCILRPYQRAGTYALCKVVARFDYQGGSCHESSELRVLADSGCTSPPGDGMLRLHQGLPEQIFERFNPFRLMDEAVSLYNAKIKNVRLPSFHSIPLTHRQAPYDELFCILSRLPLTHSDRLRITHTRDERLRTVHETMLELIEYLRTSDWRQQHLVATPSRPRRRSRRRPRISQLRSSSSCPCSEWPSRPSAATSARLRADRSHLMPPHESEVRRGRYCQLFLCGAPPVYR